MEQRLESLLRAIDIFKFDIRKAPRPAGLPVCGQAYIAHLSMFAKDVPQRVFVRAEAQIGNKDSRRGRAHGYEGPSPAGVESETRTSGRKNDAQARAELSNLGEHCMVPRRRSYLVCSDAVVVECA